jgi:hypothetical protein
MRPESVPIVLGHLGNRHRYPIRNAVAMPSSGLVRFAIDV